MSSETELKRKIGSILGKSVLATALVLVPVSGSLSGLTLDYPSAWASGGGEGGGDADSDGDSDGGESGGGESGSDGESGDDGGSSGSGNGESGSGSSGESAESGNAGEHGGNRHGRNRGRNRNVSIPSRFGRVVQSRVRGRQIEVRYSDGWKESVKGGRYQLSNPRNKTVVERAARNSDFSRLSRAARR